MTRPPFADLALTLVAVAVTVIESTLVSTYGWTWYVVADLLIHLGLTGTLLVRHRWRRASFVAAYALLAALAVVVAAAGVNLGVSPIILCAPLSLYVVARHEPTVWAATGLLLGIAGTFVSPLRYLPDGSGGTAFIPVMVLVLAGTFLWATGRRRTELAYQHSVGARVAKAEERERTRIAREVHDIVAHSLAVVQVQAGTGLAIGTEAQLRTALTTVRDTSGAALQEVRALLHVLREDPGAVVAGDLTHLATLVEQARTAGVRLDARLPDEATLAGWQQTWPAQLRLTVLRAVQEGLTNVIRHGGPAARARLALIHDGDTLTVRLDNDRGPGDDPGAGVGGRGAGHHLPGYGLAGLRERVALADGTLQAGPVPGGFRLSVTVPVPQEDS